ncbi:MAG: Asp-tRNA(Asn)/Glu-tRNA(Gln) amidotransferase subunit GatC [Cytophagaceae bacterium]|nr:Asp-tRNA(Asn)/Glu-tRNA(Gln) amidotransferase subunit GatC [Cytophagaceae bacterium]MDW8456114.1 Asp-tRNA(Asn)/Glu-tRNA(Gln) amidotransferase subunit GatC [Cytophagaceae bacterium]
MKIDKKTVENIAHLARLEFTEEEKLELTDSLSKILDWVDKLSEINTEGVEPLIHMSEETNVLREDIPQNTLSHSDALDNAPKKDSDYFRVPKFLG